MLNSVIIRIQLLCTFSFIVKATILSDAEIFAVSANCSSDSTPCGPAPSCCASGLQCLYRRGIPVCQSASDTFILGFDQDPCADPYLFRCDEAVSISGFCCPIGTVCYTHGTSGVVQCVDALGTTAPALPSATTGLIPSATPILGDNAAIVYSPAKAWNTSSTDSKCTTSNTLRVTNTFNATISFNYTGPSIRVQSVTSENGGVFSVLVDGFNTTNSIDTYSLRAGPGNASLPACYPMQFPPFIVTPPQFQDRENHTLTLVYIGPSNSAPAGQNSIIQFDSLAIPDPEALLTSGGDPNGIESLNIVYLFYFLISFSLRYMF